ncbi:hypothetical protein ARTHRO9V_160268 [Arthrobacter sp. 9V]|nr:hypothetical protein ARTHRO9V_160268 [Arthrobacter sp. 9V]
MGPPNKEFDAAELGVKMALRSARFFDAAVGPRAVSFEDLFAPG